MSALRIVLPSPVHPASRTTNRRKLLTGSDRALLKSARTDARRKAEVVKVSAYERKFYRLPPTLSVLASWEAVEESIFRLCSARDRKAKLHGFKVTKSDTERAKNAIAMLEDAFLV